MSSLNQFRNETGSSYQRLIERIAEAQAIFGKEMEDAVRSFMDGDDQSEPVNFVEEDNLRYSGNRYKTYGSVTTEGLNQ